VKKFVDKFERNKAILKLSFVKINYLLIIRELGVGCVEL